MDKGLQTLIRLQNWKIDQMRRQQGDLEAQRAAFVQQGLDLEAEVAREKEKAPEMGIQANYGAYAHKVVERREALKESIKEVDEKIRILSDQLADLFQELKRYEIALEGRERAAEEDEKRKTQINLDEISMNMHRRQNQRAAH